MPPDLVLRRFVRGLLGGAVGICDGDAFVLPDGRRASAIAVRDLVRAGAVAGSRLDCAANSVTAAWLKRARLDADAFAAQHRLIEKRADGVEVNLTESPLARLAAVNGTDTPFLARHHVEAGERVRRLVERAQLQPQLTMAYSASRTAGNRQQAANDISDLAADARRAVSEIHRVLPGDCAGVVMDVCGLLKGLQVVERERGWPRRSAKLVLRIGLDQLAQHYGLGPFAVGAASKRTRQWMAGGARPQRFE
jgi:hypothetical protein